MPSIDLNCDMGESFGAYTLGNDEALMKYVTSVNIACGFHAGDPGSMRKTVELAVKNNVAIGAHPGYPDLQGFGRRDIKMSAEEVYDMVVYQVGSLTGFCNASGTRLRHVKPHGALYNAAAKDPLLARAIARAVNDVDSQLILVGLSNSYLVEAAQAIGLRSAHEAFADRTYQPDGALTPRTSPNALIEHPDAAAAQVLQLVKNQTVRCVTGELIPVKAETVCLHGDGRHALEFAKTIVAQLTKHDVAVKPL